MKYKITDKFWSRYRELVRTEMIPYQWNVLNDAIDVNIEKERDDDFIPNLKSHAIENFKIAAGRVTGEHYGWVFQDSDVYKWLEAVAYSLKDTPDQKLKELADSVVELIYEAQEEDGYLNTYFTITSPERRFKRLSESHELYCAGHFIEAAVAYNDATGNERVLEVAIKLADCIDNNFGPEEGKIHGYDGHEEIELALMRLYEATNNEKYVRLAKYFIEERGKNPDFFREQNKADGGESIIRGLHTFPDSYFQNHMPVVEQETAEGHAVRLVYMCTALAAIAKKTGDEQMQEACIKIWRNIVDKRMYITGGIGSTVIGESFTLDYDLPNDVMYCETCAGIGLMFFARQMLNLDADGEYADVMERALYNTVISGMALDGRHFFYVNPLEVNPSKDKKNPTKSHVKPVRPEWLGCACCPPNLARLVTSLEKYIYSFKENEVLVNLYVDSTVTDLYRMNKLTLVQETNYPQTGDIRLSIRYSSNCSVRLGIRVPSWSDKITVNHNGNKINPECIRGYVYIQVRDGDVIELSIDMLISRWYASLNVSEDTGKVAIARGPVVYCMEQVDNGENLHQLMLPKSAVLKYKNDYLLDGKYETGCIETTGLRNESQDTALYSRNFNIKTKECNIRLVPYYSWANRGENEMRVWINEA